MKHRGLQVGMRSALVCAGVMLGAHAAQAQSEIIGPTTVHSFTLNVKGVLQDERGNGQDVIDRHTVNQRDLAKACLGRSVRGREKIVLVTDCGDVVAPYEALVLVVDTDTEPASIVTDLGMATLDPVARKENNDDETQEVIYRLFGELDCDDLEVEFVGFAKASFKQLDPKAPSSPICANAATGKALGRGEFDDDDVVLEYMNFTAGGRSKNIEVPADDINDYFDD